MAKKPMTENSRRVFDFLKDAGVGVQFSTKQVQKALGLEKAGSVTGSVTGLVKKGYAERITVTETDAEGNEVEVKKFYLTDAGYNFNPDLVEDED